MVKIRVVCGDNETDFSTWLSNQTGSFLHNQVAPKMRGHQFKIGDTLLSQTKKDKLSEIGLSLLDDGVYGTIQAISGKHPFSSINNAYREGAIRRANNQLKLFDSYEEFRRADLSYSRNFAAILSNSVA